MMTHNGRFLPWIEQEFGWGQATAYRLCRAENIGLTNLVNVQIEVSALYLLAARKTPEVMDPRGERKYSDR